jgi:hypothetical protein
MNNLSEMLSQAEHTIKVYPSYTYMFTFNL